MNAFIKKTLMFLILLFIVIICSMIINKVIVMKMLKEESELPEGTKWLVIGDSHITNSINPKGFPWIQNRAHSGERIPYNFEKIKFYINNNPQVELVVLGYWYTSLNYDMNWILYGKDAKYRYESYMSLMLYNKSDVSYLDVQKNKKLFRENYWGYRIGYPSPAVRLLVKNYFSFNRNLEMKGGFLSAKCKYVAKKSLKKKDTNRLVIDSLSIKNLSDIIRFLKNKNVKLILYNTPVRQEFLEPFNESNLLLLDSIAESFVDNKNVWYINHSKYEIPDEYFNDIHHLNKYGADYMTPIIVDSIEKILIANKGQIHNN